MTFLLVLAHTLAPTGACKTHACTSHEYTPPSVHTLTPTQTSLLECSELVRFHFGLIHQSAYIASQALGPTCMAKRCERKIQSEQRGSRAGLVGNAKRGLFLLVGEFIRNTTSRKQLEDKKQ